MTAGPGPNLLTLARIIWAALLGAVAVYYAALTVLTSNAAAADSEGLAIIRGVLWVFAGLHTVAIVLIQRRLRQASLPRATSPGAGPDPRRALTLSIVCWALAEAIALYGFVLGFLSRASEGAATFFLWSALALLLTRPRGEDFQSRSAALAAAGQPIR